MKRKVEVCAYVLSPPSPGGFGEGVGVEENAEVVFGDYGGRITRFGRTWQGGGE